MGKEVALLAVAACISPLTLAQTPQVDHFSQAQLLQKAKELGAHLQNGSAASNLNEYPNHYIMISLRQKDGGAEVHEASADFFLVYREAPRWSLEVQL